MNSQLIINAVVAKPNACYNNSAILFTYKDGDEKKFTPTISFNLSKTYTVRGAHLNFTSLKKPFINGSEVLTRDEITSVSDELLDLLQNIPNDKKFMKPYRIYLPCPFGAGSHPPLPYKFNALLCFASVEDSGSVTICYKAHYVDEAEEVEDEAEEVEAEEDEEDEIEFELLDEDASIDEALVLQQEAHELALKEEKSDQAIDLKLEEMRGAEVQDM